MVRVFSGMFCSFETVSGRRVFESEKIRHEEKEILQTREKSYRDHRPALKSKILERFFVQSMPPHFSVQRLVVDLRLLRCRRDAALVLN
jgi:hypothetical protein